MALENGSLMHGLTGRMKNPRCGGELGALFHQSVGFLPRPRGVPEEQTGPAVPVSDQLGEGLRQKCLPPGTSQK